MLTIPFDVGIVLLLFLFLEIFEESCLIGRGSFSGLTVADHILSIGLGFTAATAAALLLLGIQVLPCEALIQRLIVCHDEDVAQIHHEHNNRLPQFDLTLGNDADKDGQDDQPDGVVGAIPEEGPPSKLEDLPGEEGAARDDEQDVEGRRADDGADAHFGFLKRADERREELRGRTPGRHEGGAGHVHRQVQAALRRHLLEGGDEELVTHDGQRQEHVYHADDVPEQPPRRIGRLDVRAKLREAPLEDFSCCCWRRHIMCCKLVCTAVFCREAPCYCCYCCCCRFRGCLRVHRVMDIILLSNFPRQL
mmetsp:Transcript_9246/g.21798  ORF Transcript_9246/g.21798 Transcript_9246/m.21798 type:complete len:307 (-) Transcript_9246:438-1358(-)